MPADDEQTRALRERQQELFERWLAAQAGQEAARRSTTRPRWWRERKAARLGGLMRDLAAQSLDLQRQLDERAGQAADRRRARLRMIAPDAPLAAQLARRRPR